MTGPHLEGVFFGTTVFFLKDPTRTETSSLDRALWVPSDSSKCGFLRGLRWSLIRTYCWWEKSGDHQWRGGRFLDVRDVVIRGALRLVLLTSWGWSFAPLFTGFRVLYIPCVAASSSILAPMDGPLFQFSSKRRLIWPTYDQKGVKLKTHRFFLKQGISTPFLQLVWGYLF